MEYRSPHGRFFELLAEKLNLPHYASISLFVMLTFLLGLGISAIKGFIYLYLTSYQIYVVLFGIIWVSAALNWGQKRTEDLIEIYRRYNGLPQQDYELFIRKYYRKIFDKRLILYSILASLILFVVLILVCYRYELPLITYALTPPRLLPDPWFTAPHKNIKTLVIVIAALTSLPFFAHSAYQYIFYTRFIQKFSKIPLKIPPPFSSRLFSEVNNVIWGSAFRWFVGVFAVELVVLDKFTIFSASFMVLISSLGLYSIIIPKYFLYKSNKEAKESTIYEIMDELASAEGHPSVLKTTARVSLLSSYFLSIDYPRTALSKAFRRILTILASFVTAITPFYEHFVKLYYLIYPVKLK